MSKLLFSLATALAARPCSITVGVGEIHDAVQRVGALDGDTVVCLEQGVHILGGKTLSLPASASNVEFRGLGDGATISGGVSVPAWQQCNVDARCPGWEGVWVAYVKDMPQLTSDMLPVRHLWVNGTRVKRSFVEGETLGLTTTSTGYYTTRQLDWANSAGADGTELRWPRLVRNWIEPRCTLTNASKSNVSGTWLEVDPVCWERLATRNNGKLPSAPTYIENVVGAPGPNEFFADKDYIFYRPDDVFPRTTAPSGAVVPVQEVLFSSTSVSSHTWANVEFSYSTWRSVAKSGGYVPSQSGVNNGIEPFGAVQVSGNNISFDGCTFSHIGGPYALSIGNASQGVSITRCSFSDLTGGAVKLANVNDTRAVTKDPNEYDTDYTLQRCVVEGAAVEMRGAAAFFIGYVRNADVSYNTITDTGYTGISLGWGWGRVVSFAQNNHIHHNRLERVMQALVDGGCIYSLGPQPNSSFTYNYCKSDSSVVVGAFYHDNGSRYFTNKYNVAEMTPAPCLYLQGCCNSPALDINASNIWCRNTAPIRNGCAAERCVVDNATVHYVPGNTTWPDEAQSIIDSSGARAPGIV